MGRRQRYRELELEIEGWTSKGEGLAYFAVGDGDLRLVAVPFTLPGDRVSAQVGPRKKGKHQGRLLKVLQKGPDRVEAHCAHFGACGGCRWQHVPYEKQLEQKEGWIRSALERVPCDDEIQWAPILGCAPPWHYRNKMEFTFSQNRERERFLGLLKPHGRGRVEDLRECFLVNSWQMKALEVTRSWWEKTDLEAYFAPADRGALRCLTLREGMQTGDRMAILLVSGNPNYALKQEELNLWTKSLVEALEPEGEGRLSLFLRVQQIAKGRPTQFYEMLLHGPDQVRERITLSSPNGEEKKYEFGISPTAFFQPNTQQAEQLYQAALDLSGAHSQMQVLDLYCGTGTLGICIASSVKKVVGVEICKEAVLDARSNAEANGVKNIEFFEGDVGAVLEAGVGISKPDLVLVDPPRAGLDSRALEELARLNAKKILYISCNPKTQGENLRELGKMGYRLCAVQPVDQFPQTLHVENIAVMEKV